MNKVTENLTLEIDDIKNLFGNLDSNIDLISKEFDVFIKNNEIIKKIIVMIFNLGSNL